MGSKGCVCVCVCVHALRGDGGREKSMCRAN